MDQVLVTGGAGFIGSHVAAELLKLGKNVIVLDDLSGGFKKNIPEGAEFIQGSILDIQLLDNIFRQNKVTHVYHLAAYAAEGLSHFIKNFNYNNNLIGSVNLINQAVNNEVECFIFTSSIAVYGTNQLPYTEETIPQPEDSYGIAKYAVEMELKASHKMFGLNYIIFRPHNVYGEKQNIGDKYRNVIGIFMNNILQKKPMTIFGDGSQTRAFSYISDVAPAVAHSGFMPEVYNQIFNIGANKPYSVKYLAEQTAIAMGVNSEIKYLAARNEVLHAYSDHTKAEKYFGRFIENVDLSVGLQRMAAWVKSVGYRRSKKFDNIEIKKNLPASWLDDIPNLEPSY